MVKLTNTRFRFRKIMENVLILILLQLKINVVAKLIIKSQEFKRERAFDYGITVLRTIEFNYVY